MSCVVQKMKKVGLIIIATCMIITKFGYASITITNIEISPPQPTSLNMIDIQVSGGMSSLTYLFEQSVLTFSDKQINLNIYFTSVSGPQIPFHWSHTETIGSQPIGNYEVAVSVYSKLSSNYILQDTQATAFQVVPEPTAISLLAFGVLLSRKKK